jgi:hypothetical protein
MLVAYLYNLAFGLQYKIIHYKRYLVYYHEDKVLYRAQALYYPLLKLLLLRRASHKCMYLFRDIKTTYPRKQGVHCLERMKKCNINDKHTLGICVRNL